MPLLNMTTTKMLKKLSLRWMANHTKAKNSLFNQLVKKDHLPEEIEMVVVPVVMVVETVEVVQKDLNQLINATIAANLDIGQMSAEKKDIKEEQTQEKRKNAIIVENQAILNECVQN